MHVEFQSSSKHILNILNSCLDVSLSAQKMSYSADLHTFLAQAPHLPVLLLDKVCNFNSLSLDLLIYKIRSNSALKLCKSVCKKEEDTASIRQKETG